MEGILIVAVYGPENKKSRSEHPTKAYNQCQFTSDRFPFFKGLTDVSTTIVDV